jgi:hypothetical protein
MGSFFFTVLLKTAKEKDFCDCSPKYIIIIIIIIIILATHYPHDDPCTESKEARLLQCPLLLKMIS